MPYLLKSLSFAPLVDKHFPEHFGVERKLRALFSCAVCLGDLRLSAHEPSCFFRHETCYLCSSDGRFPGCVASPIVFLFVLPNDPGTARFSSSRALLIRRLSSILEGGLSASSVKV
jgi:hypothetical protein